MATVISRSMIDSVLVQWGDRLFYPGNRIVKTPSTPRLGVGMQLSASEIRRRIEATVTRRAPQVVIRITGGDRGMRAIAEHFNYISMSGRLAIEDDRGEVLQGKEALRDLVQQWRLGGSLIDEVSPRREAFHLVLAMPTGTDAQIVLRAARQFALAELKDHRYVMVLHEHQRSPHVHLNVRAESMGGKRLHPHMTDLHRWRETFAEQLRGYGVDAEATRQATRAEGRRFEPPWQLKERSADRFRCSGGTKKSGDAYQRSRIDALEAWAYIVTALRASNEAGDHELAERISAFIRDSFFAKEHGIRQERDQPERQSLREVQTLRSRTLDGPTFNR